MKALFLYTELAPYVVACMQRLADAHGVEVHVVRWPVNREAPFELKFGRGLVVHDRASLDDAALAALVDGLDPAATFVSGWIDKGYLKVARRLRARGRTVVLCSDTAWRGGARQWAAVAMARILFPRIFSHAWVTGEGQRRYAAHLGFAAGKIRTGFYAADTAAFLEEGRRRLATPGPWPHDLLCVARYIPSKEHQLLCDAFAALCDAGGAGDWTLTLTGTGECFEAVTRSASGQHPRIRHRGFVQADAMPALVAGAGAFVLPSSYEPWGVVVHEQACAAQPLLLSDAVGARERFLRDGLNGFVFHAGDMGSLTEALRRICTLDDAGLRDMARVSHALGAEWGPSAWADQAFEFMQQDRR